ncbi:unnamed protein product [Prunus armeniaca]|uniref:Retrotransposon gag domain-containing protein n=1 Tax=Prunus armeniaca TaxID=36596 RepID=A0A6J5UBD4_PRUAR|nr:unnamed protein product [Prunus armeniaca]
MSHVHPSGLNLTQAFFKPISGAASPSSTKRHTKFSVISAGNVVMAIAQTILTQDLANEYDSEVAVKSLEQVVEGFLSLVSGQSDSRSLLVLPCMTRASTRHNSMDNRVQSVEALLAELLNRFDSLDSKYDQLRKECSERSDSTLHPPVHDDVGDRPRDFPFPGPVQPPLMKIKFPRFCDGDDPLGWIYKAEHYFDYFAVPNDRKTYPTWEEFTKVFCQEFGPSEFDDCAEALVKLRQTGPPKAYITEFRRLANRTKDMSPSLLKSCFVGGVDAKFQDLHFSASVSVSKPSVSFPSASPKSDFPIKRLTPEEVQLRRQKGLCFHCDEKFVCGHTCAKKQLLLIEAYDGDVVDVAIDSVADDLELQMMEVTACALLGTPAPMSCQTMKVTGFIKNCPVIILFDSGSSHNFVDTALVKRLGWQLDATRSFNVMIANGGQLGCKGVCSQALIKIQDYQCVTDLFAINLGGCDVVLGAQWLRTLGLFCGILLV